MVERNRSGSVAEASKKIRGKVKLVVDEVSLQNSAMTTPKDTRVDIKSSMADYTRSDDTNGPRPSVSVLDDSEEQKESEEAAKPTAKPISKGLEMIRKTMS